jgi:uncharacterized membrane protein YfcA
VRNFSLKGAWAKPLFLGVLIFLAALLYSSVGHGGASGYLAAMALMGITPEVMKPTALALNILVTSIATFKFYRAGYFSWRLLWRFACTSVPFSFLGGTMTVPGHIYKPVIGTTLLFAAYRFWRTAHAEDVQSHRQQPPLGATLVSGAGIGFLSGISGVGGGIFLTPLLVFIGWSDTKRSSGVSAGFILVNSVAGLAGHLSKVKTLPTSTLSWALAAAVGGWIGAEIGSKRLGSIGLRRMLSAVLVVAGVKMLLGI